MYDAAGTTTRRRAPLTLLLTLGLLVGACGSTDDGTSAPPSTSASSSVVTAADLEGRTFLSDDVQGRTLVGGTRVKVAFDDGTMAVSAGCNTLFATYAVADGSLRWAGPPASTRMGCPADLSAQDDWLTGLFSDGLAARVAGRNLTLRSVDITIALRSAAG